MASVPLPRAIATPRRRELAIGLGCAALTIAVWTSFILVSRHGATGTLTPFDLVALRFGVAGLLMLPIFVRVGLRGLSLTQALVLVVAAGPFFANIAYFGFAYAPASHAGVLMPGVLPFWAALLAWLVLGQRLRAQQVVCLAIILSGIAALFMSSALEAPPGAWVGDLIFPLAPLSWAVFTVLARRWSVPPVQATALVAVGSMALFTPVYLLFLPKGLGATPLAEIIFQGFFQGFVAVIVGVWAYTRAVQALGPATTTMLTAAVPGIVAVLAIPLLGEPLTPLAGLGLVLVTAGMLGTVLALRARVQSEAPR